VALPHQTHAQRQIGEPGDAVLNGSDVVAHLLQIGVGHGVGGVRLEHVRQAGLRPLDPAARHSLAGQVGRDEEMRSQKQPSCPGETSQGCVGIGKR
jgi:hypothetical protein